MKKSFLLFFILIFCLGFAQLNIEVIEKNVVENPQKYYHDYMEIFKKNPDQLTKMNSTLFITGIIMWITVTKEQILIQN